MVGAFSQEASPGILKVGTLVAVNQLHVAAHSMVQPRILCLALADVHSPEIKYGPGACLNSPGFSGPS